MNIVRKILFGLRSAKRFRTAAKLAYERKDQEALDILREYEGPPEYAAKAELMSADILFRMHRYRDSVQHYRAFLELHAPNIGNQDSQDYLKMYAVYFQENALRSSGEPVTNSITMDRLRALAVKAPFLDRNEFPLP